MGGRRQHQLVVLVFFLIWGCNRSAGGPRLAFWRAAAVMVVVLACILCSLDTLACRWLAGWLVWLFLVFHVCCERLLLLYDACCLLLVASGKASGCVRGV